LRKRRNRCASRPEGKKACLDVSESELDLGIEYLRGNK
jgi:hypothetical protein